MYQPFHHAHVQLQNRTQHQRQYQRQVQVQVPAQVPHNFQRGNPHPNTNTNTNSSAVPSPIFLHRPSSSITLLRPNSHSPSLTTNDNAHANANTSQLYHQGIQQQNHNHVYQPPRPIYRIQTNFDHHASNSISNPVSRGDEGEDDPLSPRHRAATRVGALDLDMEMEMELIKDREIPRLGAILPNLTSPSRPTSPTSTPTPTPTPMSIRGNSDHPHPHPHPQHSHAHSSTGGGGAKPKRAQVRNACTNCQKACKKCSNQRPCLRCEKYGLPDCVDSARKPRKKGVKRGPYKRRTSRMDGQEYLQTRPVARNSPQAQVPPPSRSVTPAIYIPPITRPGSSVDSITSTIQAHQLGGRDTHGSAWPASRSGSPMSVPAPQSQSLQSPRSSEVRDLVPEMTAPKSAWIPTRGPIKTLPSPLNLVGNSAFEFSHDNSGSSAGIRRHHLLDYPNSSWPMHLDPPTGSSEPSEGMLSATASPRLRMQAKQLLDETAIALHLSGVGGVGVGTATNTGNSSNSIHLSTSSPQTVVVPPALPHTLTNPPALANSAPIVMRQLPTDLTTKPSPQIPTSKPIGSHGELVSAITSTLSPLYFNRPGLVSLPTSPHQQRRQPSGDSAAFMGHAATAPSSPTGMNTFLEMDEWLFPEATPKVGIPGQVEGPENDGLRRASSSKSKDGSGDRSTASGKGGEKAESSFGEILNLNGVMG